MCAFISLWGTLTTCLIAEVTLSHSGRYRLAARPGLVSLCGAIAATHGRSYRRSPHQPRAAFGSPGHACRSNLRLKYSSAPTASLAYGAGVKNLSPQLAQDAIAGTLPTDLTMTKLLSAWREHSGTSSVGVPMARLGYGANAAQCDQHRHEETLGRMFQL